MKQILQNLKTGAITQPELPVPVCKRGHLLIKTQKSLVSLGTEKMLLEFGKANWINKARQQPDKVKMVIQKVRTDGLRPTVNAVFNRLDQPLPLGYSNAGVVLEVGEDVIGFQTGDRVISNGPHAEIISIPENLCAKIPDEVDDTSAAFTVVSAIGLQGVRLLGPTLGETIAVVGLGLIGLLSCQILIANGCRVIGFDFDKSKVDLAKEYGVDAWNLSEGVDPVTTTLSLTSGIGADGVLITASTSSNDPIDQAPQMCRSRGRVVLVGVVGLTLNRTEFFKKEISFQVSCSYGPGRYDESYEQKGLDYPIGHVRWTEQRNFQAVLRLMKIGNLKTDRLITKVVPFEEAAEAYQKADANTLGVIFAYPEQVDETRKTVSIAKSPPRKEDQVGIGVIGAGLFAGATLLPAIAKTDARLISIASAGGVSGHHMGKKFGFEKTTSDYKQLLEDTDINTIFITTQHNSHAKFVVEALEAGKHVFVEKPLAINERELELVEEALNRNSHLRLMVGFNRRFSPHAVKIKELLENRTSGLAMIMTINAGAIPADHWTQDFEKGGGRIIGEGCHFIDLARFFANAPIKSVSAVRLGKSHDGITGDKVSISLSFKDGSIATIHYLANGNKSIPKERLEIFCEEKVLQLDNFRVLKGFGFKGFKKLSLKIQNKGHQEEVHRFISALRNGGESIIPFHELKEVTLASFSAQKHVS